MANVVRQSARPAGRRPAPSVPKPRPPPARRPRARRSLSPNARGAAFLCFGIFVFIFQDVIVRTVSGSYPVHEVVFIRSVVALPLVTLIVRYTVGLQALATRRPVLQVVRGFSSFLTYVSYYLAIAALPLSEVVAITFSSPLVITLLSMIVLRERVGVLRFGAVLVGFGGVLLVTRPGSGVFDWAALIALFAAFTYGTSALISRELGRSDSAAVMSFFATITYLGASLGLGLALSGGVGGVGAHPSLAFLSRPWVVPTTVDLGLIAVTGFIAAAGFYCLTEAYRVGEASVVAPFEYTSLIWATLAGLLFFGEVPALLSVAGMALIVAAGLFVLWRESRRARLKQTTT